MKEILNRSSIIKVNITNERNKNNIPTNKKKSFECNVANITVPHFLKK